MDGEIGQSRRRLEDARFLTGHGCYVDDITLPGLLHMGVARSPHAHAVIEAVDVSAARAVPGSGVTGSVSELGRFPVAVDERAKSLLPVESCA